MMGKATLVAGVQNPEHTGPCYDRAATLSLLLMEQVEPIENTRLRRRGKSAG